MAYTISNRFRHSDRLEPDEELVQQALKDYTFDEDHDHDFVATRDLYATYTNHYQQFKWSSDLPDRLNVTRFCIALRRVFGIPEGCIATHRVAGKKLRGYIGFRGPKAVTVTREAGNPKFKRR